MIDVLIRMDIADSFIAGSEGGPDLRIRLVKTGDIVATVPVSIALFVEEEDGLSIYSMIDQLYRTFFTIDHPCRHRLTATCMAGQ